MKISKLKKALASESGAIMPFVVVLFLTMVVMAGMGVDFMRHEAARSDLQNALDRGVLAATANTQTLALREAGMTREEEEAAKKELIESYMKARTFAIATPDVEVSVPADGELDDGETAVSANADYDIDTFFLKIAGFGRMRVPAASYAEQLRVDIEVALVLDISGSMADPSNTPGTSKMRAMQDAVIEFLERLLADEETRSQTLVSIIPYSGHASANPQMATFYDLQPPTNFQTPHSYSWCFDFDTSPSSAAFDSVVINPDPTGSTYRQYQHLVDLNEGWSTAEIRERVNTDGTRRYTCPAAGADDTDFIGNPNTIMHFSNNIDDLRTKVNNLETEGWTTTYNGIKWGAALLDPSSRTLLEDTRMGGVASPLDSVDFDGWPRNYGTPGAKKYLIVMSDGRNTNQKHISNVANYYTPTPDLTPDQRAVEEQQQYLAWNYAWDGTNWDSSFPPAGLVTTKAAPTNRVNGSAGDALTRNMCDAVKLASRDGGLTIFTIGYELDDSTDGTTARGVLGDCATNRATDFLDVRSQSPSTAFDTILQRINLLKLTQRQD